ncbi:MAG: thioredoxin family protein [Deltaproteobacteria bacterium]|nr:thioredoxin family protein [Deltaproteobacteria bacterium]
MALIRSVRPGKAALCLALLLVFPGLLFGQVTPSPGKAVLLEFSRPGCPICARMEKVLQDVAARYPDRLEVRLVVREHHEHLFKEYRVVFVPTLIVLDAAGKELFRRETPISRVELLQKLRVLGLIPRE